MEKVWRLAQFVFPIAKSPVRFDTRHQHHVWNRLCELYCVCMCMWVVLYARVLNNIYRAERWDWWTGRMLCYCAETEILMGSYSRNSFRHGTPPWLSSILWPIHLTSLTQHYLSNCAFFFSSSSSFFSLVHAIVLVWDPVLEWVCSPSMTAEN